MHLTPSFIVFLSSALYCACALDVDHYPIGTNPNCPTRDIETKLFDSDSTLPLDDDICCKVQNVLMAQEQRVHESDLNHFSVFLGQGMWSHDLARSTTLGSPVISLTCPNGQPDITFGVLDKIDGNAQNEITGCFDASIVYGSDDGIVDILSGSAFPKLIVNEELQGTCSVADCNVPVANPNGISDEELFAIGEVRGNENPALQSVHILWALRHNQWVDYYIARLKTGKDEDEEAYNFRVFNKARGRIIAEVQQVAKLYVEALIGEPIEYDHCFEETGKVVRTFEEFHHAINRYQHTQLRDEIFVETPDGLEEIPLLRALFDVTTVRDHGREGVIKANLEKRARDVGLQFTAQLRVANLAAIDCGRGRELGFASYTSAVEQLFGETITCFEDITDNEDDIALLKAIYGNDTSNIDLFVGGLAETHVDGGAVGRTFKKIFQLQLHDLMYRDEGWFERRKPSSSFVLSKNEVNEVKKLTIAEVLLQSTAIECVPEDALRVPGFNNGMLCKDDIKSPFDKNGGYH